MMKPTQIIVNNTLFQPIKYCTLVYVSTVGTICIGGYNSKAIYTTQIVTQNLEWGELLPGENFLNTAIFA